MNRLPLAAELVRSATVVVAHGSTEAKAEPAGSGFFVARDRVLTCAHCVLGRPTIWVIWQGRKVKATVRAVAPDRAPPAGRTVPHPDTAVLEVEGLWPHPCVPLAPCDPEPKDPIMLYGISKIRVGIPEPDLALPFYVGRAGTAPGELYKLAGERISPGLSGGPALNLRTHQVCGLTKSSLSETDTLGGHVVPIADALNVGGEDLLAMNREVLTDTLEALQAAQAGLGRLPAIVASRLTARNAVEAVILGLGNVGIAVPGSVGGGARAEWAARQLFNLRLGQLVSLLIEAYDVLGADVTTELCRLIAGSVPLDEASDSWWLASEAASALAAELAQERPRVVLVTTESDVTRTVFLWRAFARRTALLRPTPFGATTGPDGVPADLADELIADLAQRYNFDPHDWDKEKSDYISAVRDTAALIALDPNVLVNTRLLAELLDRFGGLRFLVCARTGAVTSGGDTVLLDLRPPIGLKEEKKALGTLRQIEQTLGITIGSDAA